MSNQNAKNLQQHIARLILLLALLVAAQTQAQTNSPTSATPQVSGQQGSSFISNAQPAAASSSDSLALAILSNKVDSELKASREHLEAMRDAESRSNAIFVVLGGILTVFAIFSWIHSWLRQRSLDQNLETRLKESDTQRSEVHRHALQVADKDEDRRASVHTTTMGLLHTHLESKIEERSSLPGLLKLQRENMEQINVLTSAIAGGAQTNVKTINEMFTAIKQILDFKVQEAQDVQKTLNELKDWRKEKENDELQELNALEDMATKLQASRHSYAKPGADFSASLNDYAAKFDRIGEQVLSRLTKAKAPTENDTKHGEIFLRRGTIAYYANDIVRARALLIIADRFYTAQKPDVIKADKQLAAPFGFTKFYEALVEKNYGKLEHAKKFIKASWDIWGKGNDREFLTPFVKAEILSALGDIDGSRESLKPMMDALKRLEEAGHRLQSHEVVYVARSYLLLGDTYYVSDKWKEAESYYEQSLEASQRAAETEGKSQTSNYFALYALAQVYEKQSRPEDADKARASAHEALSRSSDLTTKKALDTQILLNALGYFCTKKIAPEKAKEYQARVRQLWSDITSVGDLELRLFSLKQKKQVKKDVFLSELLET
jgi:tetratricopeptide (TPR) repeat protein